MAGISSLGVGSGIDVKGLVDQLLAAERKPTQNRLDRREGLLQAELSSFGTLKSALSDFRSAVETVSDASAFRTVTASSSNADAVSATADDSAATGRFDLEVLSRAEAQSVASGAFDATTSAVGSGSLTFRFGEVTTDGNGDVSGFTQNADRGTATVEIAASANSLSDVRDAVNEADIGVRASIINDGSGERLVFSANETGAANGFVVDVADDDGSLNDAAGLSQLAFNQTDSSLTINRAGADAQLRVDGLAVSRASNTVDDLIQGVTLTLKDTTTAPVNVNVEEDSAGARKLIEGFVEAYNGLQSQIQKVSGYNAETEQGAILQGNAVVRGVESEITRLMTDTLSVLEGGPVRALADIGITTSREGTLEIDGERLDEALSNNPDDVAALFGVGGQVDGDGFRYESNRSATRAGRYDVNVTQLAERASIAGSTITAPSDSAPLTIDGANDTLALTVDGVSTGTLNLTQGEYTSGSELAAEIQARINGAETLRDEGISVSVAFEAGQLRLTSARYGSESDVEITSVDTNTASSLGLSAGLADTGVDVQGTIGGVQAEGFGRFLTAQSGDPEGLRLEITGSQTGALGEVTFSRGIADRLTSAVDAFIGSDGALSSATDRIDRQIEQIGEERRDLQERLAQLEERYLAQFSAMDATVARLNQTSAFLGGQLAGLEALASRSGGGSGGN